jgi:hypothetical protein
MKSIADDQAMVAGAGESPALSLSSASLTALAGLLTILWALAFALILPAVIGTDVGWYLVAVRKWLAGAELYTGIIEVNPPLAFYLTVPATWLQDLTGLGEQKAFLTYVAVLAGVSLAVSSRIIVKARLTPPQTWLMALAVLAALMLVPFADFGQREHFMLILAMPYILMSALFAGENRMPPASRFAIGTIAVIGLALKPYFLAMPLMVTVARTALAGSISRAPRIVFSPENLAIGFGCMAYLLLIWIRHPAYLEDVLPLVRAIYIGVGHDYAFWMRLAAAILFLATPVLLIFLCRMKDRPDPRMIVMLAAIAGFTVSHLIQAKGWHYHFIPALACIILAATFYAGLSLAEDKRPLPAILALITAGYLGVANPLIKGVYDHPEMQPVLAQHADRLEGRSIANWSPRIEIAFPLANVVHGRWASRYAYLWPLSGALQTMEAGGDGGGSIKTILERIRGDMIDDLIALKPDIILISGAEAESYGVFLGTDPRFEAAFAPYSRLDVIDGIEIWQRGTN